MFKVDGVKNRGGSGSRACGGSTAGRLYPRLMPHYLAYFIPGFHPWKFGDMRIYETWSRTFQETGGDAIAAGDALARAEADAAAAVAA